MLAKLSAALLFLASNVLCDDQPKIVIVGAGVSGIAAAAKLLKNGFENIKILEAENRIGGRVNSVKLGDGFVDLGAEFCHGEEGNPVWSLVKDLDLVEHANYSSRMVTAGGINVDKGFFGELEDILKKYEDNGMVSESLCSDTDVLGECMKRVYKKEIADKYKDDPEKSKLIEPGLKWLKLAMVSYESAFDWNQVRTSSDFADLKGDFALIWNGKGYKTFLDVLMEKFPDKKGLPIEEKVELNKEVEKISLGDDKITIKTKDGAIYEADHVIVTPSVGVLKENHESLFEPKLPEEKIKAIKDIGIGAVVKVFLRFATGPNSKGNIVCHPLWTSEDDAKIREEFPEGVTKDGKVWVTSLVAGVYHSAYPNITTLWYSGDAVPEMEKLPKDIVVKGAMYAIKKMIGFEIADPEESLMSSWWSNPHFRGTWSYESIADPHGERKLPNVLAVPVTSANGKCTVHFAGEASSLTLYGTVGGAMESGFREAQKIIDTHKKK